VTQQDLDVAEPLLPWHRHLVEGGDAARGRQCGGGELELLDPVLRAGLGGPPTDLPVRVPGDAAGETTLPVTLDPVGLHGLREGECRGVHQREVTVDPTDHEGAVGDRIELLERREPGVLPPRFVEALQQDHGIGVQRGPTTRQGDQLGCGPGFAHLVVREREPGAREMHVRVDETRHDRRPGKLHDPVRLSRRRLAGAHPLDVPSVDQDPFPGGMVGEGVDARCSIEGPHGGRIIPCGAGLNAEPGAAPETILAWTIVLPSCGTSPSGPRALRQASNDRSAVGRSSAVITTSSTHRTIRPPPCTTARSPIARTASARIADGAGPTGRPLTPSRCIDRSISTIRARAAGSASASRRPASTALGVIEA
jgi:hypothetical protein